MAAGSVLPDEGIGYASDPDDMDGSSQLVPEDPRSPSPVKHPPRPQMFMKSLKDGAQIDLKSLALEAGSPSLHWVSPILHYFSPLREQLGHQVRQVSMLSMCTGMWSEGAVSQVCLGALT